MAHNGRGPVSRHDKFVSSRDTHTQSGFDPTVGGDPLYGANAGPQIGAWQIPPGSINDGTIDEGGLDGDESITPGTINYTPFADTVRPVGIVAGGGEPSGILLEDGFYLLLEIGDNLLTEVDGDPADLMPALPNVDYPPGSFVFNTADYKLYRNVLDVWVRSVDGLDLIADTVTAGAIAAGAISASEIAAGAITTEKIAAGAVTANEIAADAVTATKIDVATLSAIAADVGTLTAGTVRDSASKILLELASQRLRVTDGTDDRVLVGAIGGGDFGLKVMGPGGDTIIDGTSNVFKIVASGTQSVTITAGNWANNATTVVSGLTNGSVAPIAIMHHSLSNSTGLGAVGPWPTGVSASASGVIYGELASGEITAVGATSATVRLNAYRDNTTGSLTYYQSYFVMKEVAF